MAQKPKTILLLGGSAQQLVAIRAAKEMGLRTVLCDYLPDNPGQHLVDKFYNVSTTEVEAVYDVAVKEAVDGILAYASDPAALPAAIVCERLGLPTNPASSVEILGVKHRFREFLGKNGFPCPKNYAFSPSTPVEELIKVVEGFEFPVIVKPTDSSGSKGVTKLESSAGLREAISHADSYSRNKVLIIEEYIQRGYPNVIGGDIFIVDGKIRLFGEMDCLRDFGGKGLIPIGKKKPCNLSNIQRDNLHAELQRLVTALDIRLGEMNIELLIDKDDKPHFLELGPRAGGNMIPIQLSDAFGVDLVKANVEAAMGIKPGFIPEEKPGCFMHYVLHSHIDGIFQSVAFTPEIERNIYRKCIYKQPGDKVNLFDGAGKAIGIVFLHFDTLEDMETFSANPDRYIRIVLQ